MRTNSTGRFELSASAPPTTLAVAADFRGVRIEGPAAPGGALVVSGVFQLDAAEARGIDPRPHRGLVLVVSAGFAWWVVTPFDGAPPAIEEEAGVVRGAFVFTVDLAPGTYDVTVSLGERLSNALELVVG